MELGKVLAGEKSVKAAMEAVARKANLDLLKKSKM